MLAPPSRPTILRQPFRIAAIIFVFFVFHQVYYFHQKWPESSNAILKQKGGDEKSDDPIQPPKPVQQSERLIPCSALSALDDILVVVKTGANEAPAKIPRHFDTTLRCAKHHVIYSDMTEDIRGHKIVNVLDEVAPDIIANHPDFEYYRRLQQHGRGAFSDDEKDKWATAKNTASGRDAPGWRLDKWKFLPMADKALRHKPDAKWYFFIEADTYVVWETVLAWLAQIDASKPLYLGQPMMIGDIIFAYGGAGFAITNSALHKVVKHRNAQLEEYDEFTASQWAGDCILGKAFRDVDIGLGWSFPTVVGDTPATLDFATTFGGPTKKPWCFYAGTFHHINDDEAIQLDFFERQWRKTHSEPFRHSDIFKQMIRPNLVAELRDWDNLSDNTENKATTFEECRAFCESQEACLQYSFADGKCLSAPFVKLGHPKYAPLSSTLATSKSHGGMSGWMLDRIDRFADMMDQSCATTPSWTEP